MKKIIIKQIITKKTILKIIKYITLGIVAIGLSVLLINVYMTKSVERLILKESEVSDIDVDCIIILGAMVYEDGNLCLMLQDRVIQGANAYKLGASDVIIMSGDAVHEGYDEVHPMEQYAVERSVPSENILTDSAGVSTYDSIYRAYTIFGAKKILIISQEYHLYRALYIAKHLGMEAYGLSADLQPYAGQSKREIREYVARCKDFLKVIFKSKSEYQDIFPNIV